MNSLNLNSDNVIIKCDWLHSVIRNAFTADKKTIVKDLDLEM